MSSAIQESKSQSAVPASQSGEISKPKIHKVRFATVVTSSSLDPITRKFFDERSEEKINYENTGQLVEKLTSSRKTPLHVTTSTNITFAERTEQLQKCLFYDPLCSDFKEKTNLEYDTIRARAKEEAEDSGKKFITFKGDNACCIMKATICYYMAKDAKTKLKNEFGEHVMFRGPNGEPYGLIADKRTERDIAINCKIFGSLYDKDEKDFSENIPVGKELKGKSKANLIVAVLSESKTNNSSLKQDIFPRHAKSQHKQFSYISLASSDEPSFDELAKLVGKDFIVTLNEETDLIDDGYKKKLIQSKSMRCDELSHENDMLREKVRRLEAEKADMMKRLQTKE